MYAGPYIPLCCRLHREALKQAAIDPSTGKIDISILTTGMSGAARKQRAERAQLLRALIKEKGKVVTLKYAKLFEEFRGRVMEKLHDTVRVSTVAVENLYFVLSFPYILFFLLFPYIFFFLLFPYIFFSFSCFPIFFSFSRFPIFFSFSSFPYIFSFSRFPVFFSFSRFPIESSHPFPVTRGNPATATCSYETLCFFQSISLSGLYILISWRHN